MEIQVQKIRCVDIRMMSNYVADCERVFFAKKIGSKTKKIENKFWSYVAIG